MKNKFAVLGFSILFLTGLATATTNTSFNQSLNFSENQLTENISVAHGNQEIFTTQFTWTASKTVNGTSEPVSAADFNLKVEGNASKIMRVNDYPNLPANSTADITVFGDSIGSSQPYGWYNGSLTVVKASNSSVNDSLNVSVRVDDGIKPVFNNVEFGDMMATNTQSLVVDVTDNLNVSNVSARFKIEEVVNQTTGRKQNSTVSSKELSENSDGSFEAIFESSSEIGSYWVEITAFDESSNQKTVDRSFQVNGLESVTVLENDFEFKDMRPRNDDNPERSVEKQVFRKTDETSLGVSLESFSHRKENSSMTVGVRHEDSSNIQELYSNGEIKEGFNVSKKGSYFLVVYSDSQGDTYDGTLNLSPVQQHVEIDGSIEFGGTVVDPEYPAIPENGSMSIGSFEGEMEFIVNENDVPTGIRFEGEQLDISDCKGVDSWKSCLAGYSLGEIPEIKEDMKETQSFADTQRRDKWISWIAVIGFVLFSLNSSYGRGVFEVEKRIRKSHVGQEVENLHEIELGRV